MRTYLDFTDFQTDNRDFKAMVSFDCPEKAVTDELISESFVQEQKYLRFRSLTLRSLVAAVAITKDVIPQRSKSTSMSNGSRDAIQCCRERFTAST